MVLDKATLSKSRVQQLDGISKHAERIRAFLIGQIGKNTAIGNNPVSLKNILDEIYAVINAAKALIGGRIIILECEDNHKLIQLYEKHGFKLIELADSEQSQLKTLYIHITK